MRRNKGEPVAAQVKEREMSKMFDKMFRGEKGCKASIQNAYTTKFLITSRSRKGPHSQVKNSSVLDDHIICWSQN